MPIVQSREIAAASRLDNVRYAIREMTEERLLVIDPR